MTNDDKLIIKGKLSNRDRTKLEKEFYPTYLKFYLKSKEEALNYYNSLEQSIVNNTIDIELLTYERAIKRGEKKLIKAGLGKAGDKVKFYYGPNKTPVTSGDYDKSFYLHEIYKMKKEIDNIIISKDNIKQAKCLFN